MIIFKTGDIIRAADINSNFAECDFPTGTVMSFAQKAAPTNWTKQNITNDAAIRIISGSSGGSVYGSTDFSVMFSSSFKLPVSGNMGETTLTIEQMPAHRHAVDSAYDYGSGGPLSMQHTGSSRAWRESLISEKGGSMSHSHSVSGDFTVDLSIKYIDMILCKKN